MFSKTSPDQKYGNFLIAYITWFVLMLFNTFNQKDYLIKENDKFDFEIRIHKFITHKNAYKMILSKDITVEMICDSFNTPFFH